MNKLNLKTPLRLLVASLCCLTLSLSVVAQTDEPTEEPPVIVVTEPAEVEPIAPEDTSTVISFDQLLLLVSESVAGSMLLVVIINGLKVFDPNINTQQVKTVLSLVIVGLVWGARASGQVALLESVFGWLSVAIPAGVNFLMLMLGAPAIYHAGKALNEPVLGYNPSKVNGVVDHRHAEG